MPINAYTSGSVFTVKVYKRHVNRPDTLWANTYEIRSVKSSFNPAENDLANVKAAASAIANWERGFHWEVVQFDRYVVSTWEPDGQPYSPASFDSTSFVNLLGFRAVAGVQLLPLEVCLMLRRGVAFGRDGRALYRGVLSEADVEAPAGRARLTALAEGELASQTDPVDLFGDLAAVDFQMVMKGNSAVDVIREVNTFSPSGVVMKQLNNRYFDRTANG